MISVIIPVYNEDSSINDLIEQIMDTGINHQIEVIVVDGHSDKKTLKLICSKKVIKIESEKGRANQMNVGASIAQGDLLFFLHADSKIPDNCFDVIKDNIEAGYKVGAFSLKIESEKWWLRVFISKLTTLRSIITRVPYGDQGIFITKELFESIGGYLSLPLMEDVNLMERVKRAGIKIVIDKEKIITSDRKWIKVGVFKNTLQNRLLIILYMLGIRSEKLARIYYKK